MQINTKITITTPLIFKLLIVDKIVDEKKEFESISSYLNDLIKKDFDKRGIEYEYKEPLELDF